MGRPPGVDIRASMPAHVSASAPDHGGRKLPAARLARRPLVALERRAARASLRDVAGARTLARASAGRRHHRRDPRHGAGGHRSPPATRSSPSSPGPPPSRSRSRPPSHRSALRPGAHRGSPAGSERWSGPRADRCEAGDVRIRRAQRARHGLLGWHGTGKRRAAGRETASTSRGQFLLNTRSRPRGRPDRAEAGQVTSDDRDLRRPGLRPAGRASGSAHRDPAGRPHPVALAALGFGLAWLARSALTRRSFPIHLSWRGQASRRVGVPARPRPRPRPRFPWSQRGSLSVSQPLVPRCSSSSRRAAAAIRCRRAP